jgi:peptide subunit release factor 1 (eRF1)
MQTSELSRPTLRRLAEFKPGSGRVLSLFLNLDPSRFATAQARATEVQSLVDEARRRLKHQDGLSHDEKIALRDDVDRAHAFLKNDLDARGAHGVALFLAGLAEYHEVFKLPSPVETQVVIGDSPFVEPLAGLSSPASWAVVLLNRRTARLFVGSRARLEELPDFHRERRGGLDEGSGDEARDQHALEADVREHVKQTAESLFGISQRRRIDRLLVGCQAELWGEVEAQLHSYLKQRLAGRFDVDVESWNAVQVLAAARPSIEDDERRREREALDRLEQAVGARGRGAAGLDAVLHALVERRVEVMLLDPSCSASGSVCPSCGWVGVTGGACPVDGTPLERRDDIVETAIELALTQSAEVIVVHHHTDLGRHGGIGALLRF